MGRRFTTCTMKVRYGTWESADDAARQLIAKGEECMGAYECGYCHGFHIGHRYSAKDWNVAVEKPKKKEGITWRYIKGERINFTAWMERDKKKRTLKRALRELIPNLECFGRELMRQESLPWSRWC